MTRRRYPREFKEEAVRLAWQGDLPKTHVARNLGITEKMLHAWINQYGPAQPGQLAEPGACHHAVPMHESCRLLYKV